MGFSGPVAACGGRCTVGAMPESYPLTLASLDIETDTSNGGGLDPTRSAVTAAAVAFDDTDPVVLTGNEASIIAGIDELLGARSGFLLTWNGACFDLPFLIARAEALGVATRLEYQRDATIACKYAGVPGLGEPVRARWGGTVHLDIAPLFEKIAENRGVAWSLKPVAQSFGFEPVEVDRANVHLLSPAALSAYVASDAVVTLDLARQLRPQLLVRAVLPL